MCLLLIWIIFSAFGFSEIDAHNCGTHEYLKWMSDGSSICTPCSACRRGWQIINPCSKFKDTVCSQHADHVKYANNKKHLNRRRRCTFNCNYTKPKLKCEEGSYLARKEKVCKNCTVCGPGYFLKRNCSTNRDTVCRPCKTGYFSEDFNQQHCEVCSHCLKGFYVYRTCTSKSDTICNSCPPQSYTDQHNSLYYCSTCSSCGAGRETVRNCTATQNTVCGQCKSGYFRLPNSTECAKCSACRGKSTEVEECRKTSLDKSKICIPDIILRHRELNKTLATTFLTPALVVQENPAHPKSDKDIVNDEYRSSSSLSSSSSSSSSYVPYILIGFVSVFSLSIIVFISYFFKRKYNKPKLLEEISFAENEIEQTNDDTMERVYRWRLKHHPINKFPSWSEPGRLNDLSSARSVCTDVQLKKTDSITPLTLSNGETTATDSDLFSVSREEITLL